MADDERTMTLTRTIPAPQAAIWRAWTDPERLPHWWGPRGYACRTREIDLREGGSWRFDMTAPDGTIYPNRHRFTRMRPESEIDYLLDEGPDGPEESAAEVFVRFSETAAGTEVTLRMRFPDAGARAAAAKHGALAHGYTTLDCLAEAAMPGHALSLTRILNAGVQRVWDHWTDPDLQAKWFVPQGMEVTESRFDPVSGGDWRTTMRAAEDGTLHTVQGHFEAVDPPHRLVFTHGWQDQAGEVPVAARVTLSLEEVEGGCRLILLQQGLQTEASRDGHREGWGQTLDNLAACLG